MAKNNVTQITTKKFKQVFSYEVTMVVHVIDESAELSRAQLDEKGGIVTKRDVKLLNSTPLYGEGESK